MKRAMEMREQIHKRIRDHLLNGTGSDEDIFKDMESLFSDVMSDMGSLNIQTPKSFDMAWTESQHGRTLLISPKTKDQRLEISVVKDMITIKGGSINSSFTSSYSVPGDCDASKVKMLQKDGKILMNFPYKVTTKVPSKNEKTPLGPTKDAVEI